MNVIDRQSLFSGTEPPPEHLRLDVPALAAYLEGRLEGLGSDFTVEKFKGGQSNPTYKLSGTHTYVLRRRPPGPLLPSAHAIDREYRAMRTLARAGYPVPQPYLYCDDESIIGSAFYVVSYCSGRVFWNADLPGMTKEDRGTLYSDMNERLAQLHTFDVAALGLADFGPSGGYAARNLARWSKVYRQSELETIPDMDWLIEHLPQMLPSEERVCLVHGDYGLYNLVIDNDAPRIQAVLDWEMATLGDPFIDLAHHLRPWWEPPNTGGAATSLLEHDVAALGIPSMDSYIDEYCRRLGISELPYRHFYLGFAQFRYAAMIQGILKRAAIGTSSSRAVLHRQERVFEVAALARKTIQSQSSR
jgi:aminoglycoside phosphotransferase (APT) family kinase protein